MVKRIEKRLKIKFKLKKKINQDFKIDCCALNFYYFGSAENEPTLESVISKKRLFYLQKEDLFMQTSFWFYLKTLA